MRENECSSGPHFPERLQGIFDRDGRKQTAILVQIMNIRKQLAANVLIKENSVQTPFGYRWTARRAEYQ